MGTDAAPAHDVDRPMVAADLSPIPVVSRGAARGLAAPHGAAAGSAALEQAFVAQLRDAITQIEARREELLHILAEHVRSKSITFED